MTRFSTRLETALARHTGKPAKVHDLQRLTGGANRTTMSFDADAGGQRVDNSSFSSAARLSIRVAGIVPQITPAEQARLMIAAARAGAPAPRVVAILEPADGLGEGYITERVAGETLGTRIVRDERYAAARRVMARQCGEILAAIHRIDFAEAPFLMRQDAAEHVAAHRRIVDNYDFRLPALDLALRWAAENVPRNQRHTVLHGDFRTGNMIVGEEGIRCVLDWELAQSGDPMQDLGWLCIRTWRFGGAEAGRRVWIARGSFCRVREGERSSGRSRARQVLGGVRQRQVGGRLPAFGDARRRRGRYRALRDRKAHRRAAMGLFQLDRRPRLT